MGKLTVTLSVLNYVVASTHLRPKHNAGLANFC